MGVSEQLGLWTLSVVWNSNEVEIRTFRKPDMFPSSDERREKSFGLRLELPKETNRIGVSLPHLKVQIEVSSF
jgi:hypothetical protein